MYCVRTIHDRDLTKLWYVAEDIHSFLPQNAEKKKFEIITPFGKQALECVPEEKYKRADFWSVKPSPNHIIHMGKMVPARKFLLSEFCKFLDRNKIEYTYNVGSKSYKADVVMRDAVVVVNKHITHMGKMVALIKNTFRAEKAYILCFENEKCNTEDGIIILQYCTVGKFRPRKD